MFSRDLAPTETVEALEADLLMELVELVASLLAFRPAEASEDFRDPALDFFFTIASVSLEVLRVLFLFVTLTEEVVLTSGFCSFDSFLVFALCFAIVVDDDVLNTRPSFPLAFLPPTAGCSTDFFLIAFLVSVFSASFGVGSAVWPPFG